MKRPFELKFIFNKYIVKINIVVHQIGFQYPNTDEYGINDIYVLYSVKTHRNNKNMIINDVRNIIADIGIDCKIPKKFIIREGENIMWEFGQ